MEKNDNNEKWELFRKMFKSDLFIAHKSMFIRFDERRTQRGRTMWCSLAGMKNFKVFAVQFRVSTIVGFIYWYRENVGFSWCSAFFISLSLSRSLEEILFQRKEKKEKKFITRCNVKYQCSQTIHSTRTHELDKYLSGKWTQTINW